MLARSRLLASEDRPPPFVGTTNSRLQFHQTTSPFDGEKKNVQPVDTIHNALESIKTRLAAAQDAVDTERAMAEDEVAASEVRALLRNKKAVERSELTRREKLQHIDDVLRHFLLFVMGRGCYTVSARAVMPAV